MKKLIAILTIAIVLVGAVFAATEGAGNAVLKVDVTIIADTPRFALRTSSDAAVRTGGQASVGDEDTVDLNNKAADLAAGTAATVKFDIIQVSDAKMFGGFTFEIEASDLEAIQPDTTIISATDWAQIDDASKVFTIQSDEAPAISVGDADYTYSETSGANIGFAKLKNPTSGENPTKAQIIYLGVLKATSTDPFQIGTFSCTWNGNATAVPVDYEATVTLKVAAL